VTMFEAGKTGMIGLPCGEKNYDDVLSRFHTIPACYGRTTDGRTDRIAISISRFSLLTREKKRDIVRKSQIFGTHLYLAPPFGIGNVKLLRLQI